MSRGRVWASACSILALGPQRCELLVRQAVQLAAAVPGLVRTVLAKMMAFVVLLAANYGWHNHIKYENDSCDNHNLTFRVLTIVCIFI